MTKRRIAIIGGGPGALAAAYELSATPDLRAKYAVSIYTAGWRLGGKCASGRNRDARWRNEEHGLHVLGGFYHNTFAILNELYDAWATTSRHALAFDEAFLPHAAFTVMENRRGAWRSVRVTFPRTDGSPGVNPKPLSLPLVFQRLLSWTAGLWGARSDSAGKHFASGAGAVAFEALARRFSAAPLEEMALKADVLMVAEPPVAMAQAAEAELGLYIADIEALLHAARDGVALADVEAMTAGRDDPRPGVHGADWLALAGLALTVARGLLADRVARRGFDSLNHLDARAWLVRHGAGPRIADSCIVASGYHYAFAFVDGDPRRPDFAAGVALRGLLRMFFTYEDAVFIHMNGGMGEIFATPFYEVLRARGVDFHFFHKLTNVTAKAGRVTALIGRRQAIVTRGPGAYDPLVAHSGRLCWPSAPDLDQIEPPAPSDQTEDDWTYGGEGADDFTLLADRDFDDVILAAPPAALAPAAKALARQSNAWRLMLAASATTPTLAAQIWHDRTPQVLGAAYGGIATAYEAPLSTWADMSMLLDLELPRADGRPLAALSYFCGPASVRHGDGAQQLQHWLARHARRLLPGLPQPDNAPEEVERHVRFNTNPSDLYVLSRAGTISARMACDQTGFSNLFVAGDWTKNGADVGAVEAAVMSGRQAARAICGSPRAIYGERDFD